MSNIDSEVIQRQNKDLIREENNKFLNCGPSFFEKSEEIVQAQEKPAFQQIKEFKLFQYLKESCLFYKNNLTDLKIEIISGLTVSIMQIPESVAFSFVAGVQPISGLYSTFFLGFITAAIGGKPGMISGAAGALAVVVKNMMADDGPLEDYDTNGKFQHLMMTMVLCGIFQTLCGLFQIAKLVKLIPYSAMIGFMNGLGIIIFLSQMQAFTECDGGKRNFQECKEKEREWLPIDAGRTWVILALTFLTMFIMQFYPKIPKIGTMLPGSFVAILVGTLLEHLVNRPLIGEDARTVGETTKIDGKFPSWAPPEEPENGYQWGTMLQYAISLCFIGLIESVMTLQSIEEITNSLPSQFKANQECVAQGISNLISGLFGAMGGDAMIGQSTINVKINKAKGRLSGMIAGIFILLIIIIAHKVIELIPIATLTGVLFMVVLNTFNWGTFPIIFRREVPYFDSIVIVLVTVLAVLTDLAIAVTCGVIFISLCNNYLSAENIKIKVKYVTGKNQNQANKSKFSQTNQLNPQDIQQQEQQTQKKVKVYEIEGFLHHATLQEFKDVMQPENDEEITVINFQNSDVSDISQIEEINLLTKRYEILKKKLVCANLSKYSQSIITCSGYFGSSILIMPENCQNDYFKLYEHFYEIQNKQQQQTQEQQQQQQQQQQAQ